MRDRDTRLVAVEGGVSCILSILSADRGVGEPRTPSAGSHPPAPDVHSRRPPRAAPQRDVAAAATRVPPRQLHAAMAAQPAPPVSLPPPPPLPPHPRCRRRPRPRRRHRRRYRLRCRPRASRVGPASSTAVSQRETPPARVRRLCRCTGCAHPPPPFLLRRSGVVLAPHAALVPVLNGLRCRTRERSCPRPVRSCSRPARATAAEARAAGRLCEPHRHRLPTSGARRPCKLPADACPGWDVSGVYPGADFGGSTFSRASSLSLALVFSRSLPSVCSTLPPPASASAF